MTRNLWPGVLFVGLLVVGCQQPTEEAQPRAAATPQTQPKTQTPAPKPPMSRRVDPPRPMRPDPPDMPAKVQPNPEGDNNGGDLAATVQAYYAKQPDMKEFKLLAHSSARHVVTRIVRSDRSSNLAMRVIFSYRPVGFQQKPRINDVVVVFGMNNEFRASSDTNFVRINAQDNNESATLDWLRETDTEVKGAPQAQGN